MALTPEQQRSPCTPGTEGDAEGQPLGSASDLPICGIPRTECFRETPPRELAGLPWLCLGRAGPQVSQGGDSREWPKFSFPSDLSMLWLPRLGGILVPGAFAMPVATALPAPALPCLGSGRRNAKENPAFPGTQTNPMEFVSLQLFPARPCERYCCVS